jgi:hypothetical protein
MRVAGSTTSPPTNAPCSQNGSRVQRLAPWRSEVYGVALAMPTTNEATP